MSISRPLVARVRESFRPLEADAEGGGWTYDPISQWATVTGHVVRTRGGVLSPEEILEHDMILDAYIPIESMRSWKVVAPVAPVEQPRREAQEEERPLPSRVTRSVPEYRRMFRRTRCTPRKSTLEQARLPRMAPPVTPASPPRTVRPTSPVPYVAPCGRFVCCFSDASAGPSGHADRGRGK